VKAFAELFDAIDRTTATNAKVAALAHYFRAAPLHDAAWAAAFLLGRRPKRLVKVSLLRSWAASAANIPDWLFDESYTQVGDLAETISLLVPSSGDTAWNESLDWWVRTQLLPLAQLEPEMQRTVVLQAWGQLSGTARLLYTKLMTGSFRVGVRDGLVVRALADVSGVAPDIIAHRLMGQWEPSPVWYTSLVSNATADADWSQPYPFYLAHPLVDAPESLGDIGEWQLEWKWDGIRAQIVRRRGITRIWSRGEELLTGRFPEIEATAEWLPDGTVIDGEILAWASGAPLPFSALQRRITRKSVSKTLLRDVPARIVAYDLLEAEGIDRRAQPFDNRRRALTELLVALPSGAAISVSPTLDVHTWSDAADARAQSRAMFAEGLMLKRRASPYGVGRKMGDWWKWKVEPFSVDAVLVYAQAGHGRRSGLYTDYTFAVWNDNQLVPFAKAYSGLTDAEIREVDAFVRRNTLEKFGPVRTVKPDLVFELAFEGIQRSSRHKSGIAVRFPRIARWRTDKMARDADTLASLSALLALHDRAATADD
jgi:DNA ligase-1